MRHTRALNIVVVAFVSAVVVIVSFFPIFIKFFVHKFEQDEVVYLVDTRRLSIVASFSWICNVEVIASFAHKISF